MSIQIPFGVTRNTGCQQDAVDTMYAFFTSLRDYFQNEGSAFSMKPLQLYRPYEGGIVCLDDGLHLLLMDDEPIAAVVETRTEMNWIRYDYFLNSRVSETRVKKREQDPKLSLQTLERKIKTAVGYREQLSLPFCEEEPAFAFQINYKRVKRGLNDLLSEKPTSDSIECLMLCEATAGFLLSRNGYTDFFETAHMDRLVQTYNRKNKN